MSRQLTHGRWVKEELREIFRGCSALADECDWCGYPFDREDRVWYCSDTGCLCCSRQCVDEQERELSKLDTWA